MGKILIAGFSTVWVLVKLSKTGFGFDSGSRIAGSSSVHALQILTLFTQFDLISVFLYCKLDYCNTGDGKSRLYFSTTVKQQLVPLVSKFRNMPKGQHLSLIQHKFMPSDGMHVYNQ